jgi:Pyruvate/2-oxoacid:ferredoxin oxidoreductase delta subunit
MTRRVHVVLSRGQTLHPDRQTLEDQLVSHFADCGECQVLVVPHLYDLTADGPSVAALRELDGDMIILAWLYPRATYWILDRFGIRGQLGATSPDGVDATLEQASAATGQGEQRAVMASSLPPRQIFCLDLRRYESVQPCAEAIRQILRESGDRAAVSPDALPAVRRIDESVKRRWYPVIDFGRCTNCLECIDFCLFGVYGVDQAEHVLVELPDQCRKGCPACSRVCPEHAIMFPQHKLPAIAGDLQASGSLKMNLSDLFGAVDDLLGAQDIAARERDEHLLIAGQRPAGTADAGGVPESSQAAPAKDDLDALIDQLDELDV